MYGWVVCRNRGRETVFDFPAAASAAPRYCCFTMLLQLGLARVLVWSAFVALPTLLLTFCLYCASHQLILEFDRNAELAQRYGG